MGTRSADVLRLTGAEVEVIERCSAVDGTWGMKKEYFELSMKLAEPLFEDIEAARPDRVATDCPLAALQINQGTGRTAAAPHPHPGRGLRPRSGARGGAVDPIRLADVHELLRVREGARRTRRAA